jgi:diaminopimelate epimerase
MTASGVPFVKAAACGNDFLIVEAALAPQDVARFTRIICDRHQGVGADGVEWLSPAENADTSARLINADGSAAEISGNGTRCVAAYLASKQRAPNSSFAIRTGAGVRTCVLISQTGPQFEFETGMGEPEVGPEFTVRLAEEAVSGIPVATGNPHFVVLVKTFPDNWQRRAAEIQRQPQFPQGVNIEYVIVQDRRNLEVRFFERGAGETQSSGTGSCASSAAAITAGLVERTVQVHAPGGTQTVRWEGELFLRGHAQLICRGEFFA